MTGTDRPDNGTDRWQQAASGLSAEIAPERDLWPDIAARIEAEPRCAVSPGLASGRRAGRCSGAGRAVLVDDPVDQRSRCGPGDQPGGAAAERVRDDAFGGVWSGLRAGAQVPARAQRTDRGSGVAYAGAAAGDPADSGAQPGADPLSPWQRSMRPWPRIRATALLQQLLLAAYQDELTVLTEVNRMARSLPTRTEI